MKRLLLAALLLLGAAGPASAAADSARGRPPGMSVAYTAVLQVEEPDRAATLLVARAESLGGWFSRRTRTQVEFRLPTAVADTFIAALAGLGPVLDQTLSTQSLEAERDELVSRLKVRRANLQDYYALLKESSDSTVFTLRNEIVALQAEVERTEGDIARLEERMALARVEVSFRFRERGAPLADGRTRFEWLNRLDLRSLLWRFEGGR